MCGSGSLPPHSDLRGPYGCGLTELPPNGGTPHSDIMLTASNQTSEATGPHEKMGTMMWPTDTVDLKIFCTVSLKGRGHVLPLWLFTCLSFGSPVVGNMFKTMFYFIKCRYDI